VGLGCSIHTGYSGLDRSQTMEMGGGRV